MSPSLEVLGLSSHATLWQVALLSFISLGVGILGGFVGLALGTMRLPALLLLGFPPPLAAGTNILVSTLSAITGSVRHIREGRVHWRVVGIMGIPAVTGAFLGGFLSGRAPEALLVALAGAFVTWQGVELVWPGRRRAGTPGPERLTGGRMTAEAGIGLGVGLLGGAVGLILGSIRLPAMVRILRIHPRVATGTNLFIGFLMGASGFVGHGVRGDVDVPLLVFMGVTAMGGSYYGARLTGRVPLSTLVMVMGLVLLLVGPLLLADAYRRAV